MTTTGDSSYDATALEICDDLGEELFHVVMDEDGERKVLFFPHQDRYLLSLKQLEEIIAAAKEAVIDFSEA